MAILKQGFGQFSPTDRQGLLSKDRHQDSLADRSLSPQPPCTGALPGQNMWQTRHGVPAPGPRAHGPFTALPRSKRLLWAASKPSSCVLSVPTAGPAPFLETWVTALSVQDAHMRE